MNSSTHQTNHNAFPWWQATTCALTLVAFSSVAVAMEAEPATLTDYEVVLGMPLTEGIEQLAESNNEYLEILSEHVQGRQRTTTIVDAWTDVGQIDRFDLTIETGVDGAADDVTLHVDLWNSQSGTWDEIDSFIQSASDTVSTYEDLDFDAYITADGDMRLRLRTIAELNPHNPYVFLIDHVMFSVHPEGPGEIQQMIDEASDGDVIVLEPGVYNEVIDFQGKAITLRSTDPDDPDVVAATVIDGSGFNSSVVTATSAEGPDTVLEGITITGGTGTIDGDRIRGGGMFIEDSSPTIANCVFTNNLVVGDGVVAEGGAMYVSNGNPTITNTDFIDNAATSPDLAGAWAGALSVRNNGNPTVIDCDFIDNTANIAGATMVVNAEGAFTGCEFRNNSSQNVQAGAMYLQSADSSLENCHFENNVAATNGGAIAMASSEPQIDDSTFINNSAIGATISLRVLSDGPPSVALLTNCVVEGNSIGLSEMGAIHTEDEGGSVTQIADSFICNNDPYDISGPFEDLGGNTICNVFEPNPVQAMIDAASDGDVIVLEPGVYNEVIDFQGKAITLRSTDPDDPDVVAATVIDGTGFNSSVITATSGEGPDTVLEGITITGGTGTFVSGDTNDLIVGGGMFIEDASPTIVNCVFKDMTLSSDSAVVAGAGMFISNGSPVIIDTDFINNSSIRIDSHGSGWGGGLAAVNGSDPELHGCRFIENSANGAGAALFASSNGTLADCVFDGNFSTMIQAGAMYLEFAGLSFNNCHFESNVAESGGGAISMSSSDADLVDTTFINNSANGGSAIIVRAFTDGPPSVALLSNCVVEYNASTGTELGAIHTNDEDGSVTQIADSFICNNDPIDVTGPFEDLGGNEICKTDEPAEPETIEVPEDAESITEAIEMAEDGDIILVAEGIYNEAIDFSGLEVHLQSTDGPEATIIDASGLDTSAVTFASGEGPDAILEGFTVTGGTGTLTSLPFADVLAGGGILIDGSSPTIDNVIFDGNSVGDDETDGYGAGIFILNDATPSIAECLFIDNDATSGAGIYVYESHPLIENCTFKFNTADHGGGITVNALTTDAASEPTISNCLFEGNAAHVGGGVANNRSHGTILDSDFINNHADESGGGLRLTNAGQPHVENCLFQGNTSDGATGSTGGGGVFIGWLNEPTFVNCVFEDNWAGNGGGLSAWDDVTVMIESCEFIGNESDTDGGAMHAAFDAELTILDSVIEFNSATDAGGGIFIRDDALAALADSFVCDNEPDEIEGSWEDLGGNTICPDDPGEPFVAPLLDYEVEIGEQLNDDFELDWFTEADQQYLFTESRRTQGRHRTNTIVDVDAGTAPIVQLDVHTVSGLDADPPATVTTAVELWNFDTGEWNEIDSFEQSSAGDQSSSTIDVPNPSAYVANNGTLHVRVRSEAPGNPHQSPYVYRIDHVQVVVTPEAE